MKRTPLYILPQTTVLLRSVAMHRHSVFVLTFFLAAALAQSAKAQLSRHRYGTFEENKGQFAEEVRYVARMPHVDIWITNDGLVYDVFRLDPDEKAIAEKRTRFGEEYETHRPDEPEPQLRSGQAIFVSYKNATSAPIFEAHQPVSGVFNYLSGGEGAGDVTGVERFSELYVRNVYTGIDARYYFDRGGFRYDFIVHPGADPAQIGMVFDGADLLLNTDGDLEFDTISGKLKHGYLKGFTGKGTERKAVTSRFVVLGKEVRFSLGAYDFRETLVIDPLIFGTFFGSAGTDFPYGLHVYENGESLLLGSAASHGRGIPTTPGVYMESNPIKGSFLSRFSSDGTDLIFSTYFGTLQRCLRGLMVLAVEGSDIFVAEDTECADRATEGAFDTSFNGAYDVLLSKFDEYGTQRLWATYLGGGRRERVEDILVEEGGDILLSGYTDSNDFPTTSGAYREQDHGIQFDYYYEGFVSKISSTGDQLLFSTYLGFRLASALKVSIEKMASGDLVVLTSASDNFLPSPTAFDTDAEHSLELILMVMTPDGREVSYSSYLGGPRHESPRCLLTSETGEIWIAGVTWSPGFPLTHTSSGAILTPESRGDIFVVKLNEQANQILQGTRFGSSSYAPWFTNCTVLNNEELVVVGDASQDFPLTPDGLFGQPEIGGAFISVVNKDGTDLRYSTMLEGNEGVTAYFVRAYESTVIIAGYTWSADLPTTPGAVDRTMTSDGEFGDIFLMKFSFPELVPTELPHEEGQSNSVVSLFPNPASDIIRVELEIDQTARYGIDVYSVQGQKVASRTGVVSAGLSRIPLDIRGLPPGVYVVQCVIGEKLFQSKNFVVTR